MSGRSECVALISASARAFTLGSTGGVTSLTSSIGAGSAFCCGAGLSDCKAAISGRFTPSRTRSSSCCTRSSDADLGRTLQQHVNRVIKIPLGRFQVSGFELVLSRLIFLLGVRDQIGDRIRLGLRCGLNRFGRGWFWIRFFLRNELGSLEPRQSSPEHWLGVPAASPGAARYGRPCPPEAVPSTAR